MYTYIRCTYGNFSRDNTIHTDIYGVNIRFWPTLTITLGTLVIRVTLLLLFPRDVSYGVFVSYAVSYLTRILPY